MNFNSSSEANSPSPVPPPAGGVNLTDMASESHLSSDSDDDFKPKRSYKSKKGEVKAKKSPEKKSYRCDRCNFSSCSKAKYTKHAKSAHSGTVVQCDHCEFKTPYKWNLDRHYKNHLGGGALCCHLCNFSCDIKQSLTVHLQNHHSNVPEEIIESVKRQQIPSKNQSNSSSSNSNNNNNSSNNGSNTATNTNASSSSSTKSSTNVCTDNGPAMENLPGEKKVPPLRISRSLTGLALGEENNSNEEGKVEDELPSATTTTTTTTALPITVPVATESTNLITTNSSSSGEHEIRTVRKCEHCDFETSGVGNANSEMKKHLASQHGIHHHKKHHHRHHHNKLAVRESSSSPEYNNSCSKAQTSPSLPIVPIPLPPKKSKGSTSPRPGQSASSTSNSPAIHRSQSPLKASEAIGSYAAGQSESHEDHPQSILNLAQHHQLQSSEERSAFTPIQTGEYPQQQLTPLKKPKHRALAQFYQKIKPTVVEDVANDTPLPLFVETGKAAEAVVVKPEDLSEDKNGSTTNSNRCLFCRQRCKSSADLAAHVEKCEGHVGAKKDDNEDVEKKVKKWAPEDPTETLNSSGELNDGLIGFETAPGVGSIHSGKIDEMEYDGKQDVDGESNNEKASIDMEDEDEDMDDEGEEGKAKSGKDKDPQTTSNRKVYRCPETDCSFWATTASRFHVHIVGHYNLKPFECSECHYKSNWRWDVNKHIRLKTPKDPKHAVAKTLLTHESGQRDYRKYDNYLVTMSLAHSPNSKAPDCSTSAKRTKGSTVSTPKSSPDIQTSSNSKDGASHNTTSTGKQKLSKTKVPSSSSSSSSTGSIPLTSTEENGISLLKGQDEPRTFSDTGVPSSNSNDGPARSFVETRMLAGGEIYQTSLLKQDLGLSTTTSANEVVVSASESNKPEADDKPPNGFDLTSKPTSRSRHAPYQKKQQHLQHKDEGEVKVRGDALLLQQPQIDMHSQSAHLPLIPTTTTGAGKKSRLQQQQHHQHDNNQTTGLNASSAINGQGNKVFSLWQCIKCSFKHMNKDLVSTHIREQHKPKKGDPLSLLTNNHLIQVMIPEQDADALMASSTSDEMEFSMSGKGTITAGQKKETYQQQQQQQQMYDEVGKVLSCKFCPFTTGLLYEMEIHAEHHSPTSNNYYSCPHCSYSVAVKSELQEHLRLHGVVIPLDVQINSSSLISSTTDRYMLSPTSTTENLCKRDAKKLHCLLCPFVASDLAEFEYHKLCHEPNDYPFKCHQCSFNVNIKFQLLQHLRLHGIQIDEGTASLLSLPQEPPPPPKSLLDCEYENISDPGTQDEPLNLSIFADRKPVIFWDGNGVPVEGYKCLMCPAIFRDVHELKEHEFSNDHHHQEQGDNFSTNEPIGHERECDSPPCEVLNLSVKHEDHSKKSSQNNSSSHKVSNGKRSVNSSSSSSLLLPPLNGPTMTSAAPLSSPSSLSSVNSVDASSTSSSKGEKEYLYLCDECPARFFFEKELKIHHTFHENKSPYQCPKCTYSARQKDPHLMSHMRVHSSAYKDKTKSLLLKYPRGKINFNCNSSSPNTSSTSASAAATAAALSAASLLNLNQAALLNPTFNLQFAAAALSKLKSDNGNSFNPDLTGLKNGLSIVCPKCPEKFYTPQTFQKHIELHSSGKVPSSDYRCRFCDYCAESKKTLAVHELVHTGSDITIEPAKFLSASGATGFNPVSMMAMVAQQEAPFGTAVNLASMCQGIPPATSPDNTSDKSSAPVPEEAYEGNPDFIYPTYTKNGRIKSKRYKCTKCPSAFEKKDQYHTHIGLHGSNQKYKCTVCDYAVTYYANFIQHVKKHENQRNVTEAGMKRPSLDDNNGSLLKVARMSENGENSRSSSVSSNVSSIDSHDTQGGGMSSLIPNLIQCPNCPFNAFDQATLQAHLLHHQDNPNWLHLCDVCNFRTSSKKSLKEHGKLHLHNFNTLQGTNMKISLMNGEPKAQAQYLNGYHAENGRNDRRIPHFPPVGDDENEESSNASV